MRRLAHSLVRLRARPPPNCAVAPHHFALDASHTLPPAPPPGTLRCRTLYLSVDPFLRCRFNAHTGVAYTLPYAVGGPLSSAGLGVVLAVGDGLHAAFRAGDLVVDPFDGWEWAAECDLPAARLSRVPLPLLALLPPTALLGAAGQTGLTAWCGLDAAPTLREGEVVVVSGAAGGVGSLVGQLARRRGARVVGIAGSEEKAEWLVRRLGFDRGVSYRSESFARDLDEAVEAAAGEGARGGGKEGKREAGGEAEEEGARRVALYWDNVGGRVSEHVLRRVRDGGTVVLCGQVAMYDSDEPYPPPLPPPLQRLLDERRIARERYLVLDHRDRFAQGLSELFGLVAGEELVAEETRWRGIEAAPAAFCAMMAGGNRGKALVECAAPPWTMRLAERVRRALPPSLKSFVASRLVPSLDGKA
ncbi:hypothetical protein AB1Y20_007853 [Prymnesium parvum]